MQPFFAKLHQYALLMRLDKPVGIFLLLWPTLTALWIASSHTPSLKLILIFTSGVFIMRTAGSILNDCADRNFDRHVTRTQHRPITHGTITLSSALLLCTILLLIGLYLVLQLNLLSFLIACVGLLGTAFYPFVKRFSHLPQLILGIVFNLGILMAFAAQVNHLPAIAWLLYSIALLWTIAYDTQYAMADRADDLKIGVKSTAILFGNADRFIICCLQFMVLTLLIVLGQKLKLNFSYYLSLLATTGFFIYQFYLTRHRMPNSCFHAFLNNNWAWLMVFLGILNNF